VSEVPSSAVSARLTVFPVAPAPERIVQGGCRRLVQARAAKLKPGRLRWHATLEMMA
jgi:hypothetical protein